MTGASESAAHLICHRCAAILETGTGSFYVVRIEAIADPTPPDLDAEPAGDFDAEVASLLQQMRGMSERELMDQVYRKMTIYLCRRCATQWLDDPVG